MFVGHEVVQQDLADALKLAGPASLTAWQLNLVERLHVAAFNEIVARLAARGYTLAQIQGWDQGADYERSIALALVLQSGAAADSESVNDAFVKALDWRGRLKRAVVTINGVAQSSSGPFGQPSFGAMSTANDLVRMRPGCAPKIPGDPGYDDAA